MKWIVAQNGSREHYAMPRALHKDGKLALFITDYWFHPQSFLTEKLLGYNPRVSNRYHPELSGAQIRSFNLIFLAFDFLQARFKFINLSTRDKLFQNLSIIASLFFKLFHKRSEYIFFAYNYTAYALFKHFQNNYLVLGQIDAGPQAAQINQELHTRWLPDTAPPVNYYNFYGFKWQEECRMADVIIVNSNWAHKMLVAQGIREDKIRIVPLIFSESYPAIQKKDYPDKFTEKEPMKVLFLGTFKLLKGIHVIIEAAKKLHGFPIVFNLVGRNMLPATFFEEIPENVNVLSHAKTREEVHRHYSEADLFVLPTFSDGFAITQLEAQFHKLPLIVTRNCGEVVKDGVNGLLIEPTPEDLFDKLLYVLESPLILSSLSNSAINPKKYNLLQLQQQLSEIEKDLIT